VQYNERAEEIKFFSYHPGTPSGWNILNGQRKEKESSVGLSMRLLMHDISTHW
jgi:hypothetical protein